MGSKGVSEVDEGERALPDLLQRLKEPCLEVVTSFRYFPRLRHHFFSDEISVLCKVLIPAAAYEKANKESEVDKTVCTHLENDWSNPYCYWFISYLLCLLAELRAQGSCTSYSYLGSYIIYWL